MSSVVRASVLAALVLAAPAEARTVTIHQQLAPELTVSIPDGWKVRETRRVAVLSRGERRFGLFQCPLPRSERDMTGRHAVRTLVDDGDGVALPVRGGTCVVVTGDGARAFARRLKFRLGPSGPAPRSDAAAEKLARDARRRTLAMVRVTGTASVTAWDFEGQIAATFEWDLPADYRHLVYGASEEVVRTGSEYRTAPSTVRVLGVHRRTGERRRAGAAAGASGVERAAGDRHVVACLLRARGAASPTARRSCAGPASSPTVRP